MDLSTIYTKTSKASRNVAKKMPAHASKVLSVIHKSLSAEEIHTKVKRVSENDFETAISWLLNNGYIKTITEDPFSNTAWSIGQNDAVQVAEISLDDFEHFGEKLSSEIQAENQQPDKKAPKQSKKKQTKAGLKTEPAAKKAADKKLTAELSKEVMKKAAASAKAETAKIMKEKADALTKAYEKARVKAKEEAERIQREREKQTKAEKARLVEKEAELKALKAKEEAEELKQKKIEAENKAKKEAIEKSKQAVAERKAKEAEAKQTAERKAKELEKANEKARRKAEKQAKIETDKKTKAEESARKKALSDEKTRLSTIEKASKEAEERAKKAIEEKTETKEKEKRAALEEAEAEKAAKLVQEEEEERKKIERAKQEKEIEEKAKIEAEKLAKANEETRKRAEQQAEQEAKEALKKEIEEAERKRVREARKLLLKSTLTKTKNYALSAQARTRHFFSEKISSFKKESKKTEAVTTTIETTVVEKPSVERKPIRKIKTAWLSIINNVVKRVTLFASVAILLIVVSARFINMSILIKPVEGFIAENIQDEINIQAINASVFPTPHLILKKVSIGSDKKTNISQVIVFPKLSKIKGHFNQATQSAYDIRSVTLQGLDITHDNFSQLPVWLKNNNPQQLKIGEIHLKNMNLLLSDVALKNLDANILLNEVGEFKKCTIENNNKSLSANIEKINEKYKVGLKGLNWKVPTSAPTKPIVEKVDAAGYLESGVLKLTPISANLYNGELDATLLFNTNTKKVEGTFNIKNVSLKSMVNELKYNEIVDGKLGANGTFNFDLTEAEKVKNTLNVKAKFNIQNGHLNRVDIAQAMMRGNINGSTYFNDLSGNLVLKKENYRFTQLILKQKQLLASGAINISAKRNLSGVITSRISVNKKVIRSRLKIAGTPQSVRLIN